MVVADVLWVVAQVHFVVGRDVQLQVLGEVWLVSGRRASNSATNPAAYALPWRLLTDFAGLKRCQ